MISLKPRSAAGMVETKDSSMKISAIVHGKGVATMSTDLTGRLLENKDHSIIAISLHKPIFTGN